MHRKDMPFYRIHTLSFDFNKTDSLWVDKEYRLIKRRFIDDFRSIKNATTGKSGRWFTVNRNGEQEWI
jgi:hypothetical protein